MSKGYNYNFRTQPEELEHWRSAYYKYMVQHPEPSMPFSQWLKLMIHTGIAASGVDTPSEPSQRVS